MSEESPTEKSTQSSSLTDDLIIEPGINANVQIGRLGHLRLTNTTRSIASFSLLLRACGQRCHCSMQLSYRLRADALPRLS